MRRRLITLAAVAAAAAGAAGAAATGPPPEPSVHPHVDPGPAGVPMAGTAVRVTQGVWTGAPTSFAVTWERCAPGGLDCTPIAGETVQVYVPRPADAGWTLRARVAATGPGGTGEAVTATTAAVLSSAAPPAPRSPATSAAGGPAVHGGGGVAPGTERTRAGGRVPRALPRAVTVGYGSTLRLTGLLAGATDGRRIPVELRDPTGALVRWGLAGADGSFRVDAPASTPGRWTVATADGATTVRVTLRPRVVITAATGSLRAPAVVEIRGFIAPGAAGKTVELQYLDPGRGWRLWRQTTTRRNGAFRLARVLARNARAPWFTLRVRVAVPADRGWPFAPAVSAVREVRVT